jgi:RNA polymerase sigma-70 factor (ECF subfamily)
MTSDSEDARRVSRCLAGDTGAFADLVRENQDAVFSLIWRMTGDWHEAADIVQEAFIKAYEKLHTFKPEYKFRNWVMSIGSNLARNRFRGEARRRQREDAVANMQSLEEPASAPASDEGLEEALRQLSEPLREALLLKHMEGLSYDETAQILGIGVSAAKMRVARGRDELVRLLEKEGVTPR